MDFLADHCVSEKFCQILEDQGHKVVRVKEVMPTDSPDEQVISKAQDLNAVLVSLNGDFSHIENYPPSQFGGIISLRLQNKPSLTPLISDLLLRYLKGKSQEDLKGILVIVEPTGYRLRSSP